MKYLFILLIGIIVGSCNRHEKFYSYSKIAVPEGFRFTGYDSLIIEQWDTSYTIDFFRPNNLRYKKDTIYTGDTAYREFNMYIRMAPNIYIATKSWATISNGMWHDEYCDSMTLDSFKFKITKVPIH